MKVKEVEIVLKSDGWRRFTCGDVCLLRVLSRQVGEERYGRHIWLRGNPVPLLGAALHPRLIVY